MSSGSLRIDHGGVRAWYALTSECGDAIGGGAAAASWLNDQERVRHARFAEDDDRRMFLLGRVMARTLVGAAMNTPPTSWQWHEGPHGRPEIAGASDLAFNLAHSAGLVACALASGREVGIDVEDLQRTRVDPAVVRRYCSPAEVADVESRGDAWHDRFLHYWTLKEAYLKARGLGISVPLREIRFHLETHEGHEEHEGSKVRISFEGSLRGNDDRWSFLLTRPTERHLVAVAVSTANGAAPPHALERLAGLP
jgi:4'-phosphopantetheinyl transferase